MELLIKTSNPKESFSDSLGHNILRLFDVLPNFHFTTSETKRDYTTILGIYKAPNELRLNFFRKLGNIRKISKLHEMIA